MKQGLAIGLILGVGLSFLSLYVLQNFQSELPNDTIYPDLARNQFLNDRGLVSLKFIEFIRTDPDKSRAEAVFLLRNMSEEKLACWATSEIGDNRYRLFGSAITYISQIESFSVRWTPSEANDDSTILFTIEPGEEALYEVSFDLSWIKLHPTDKIQIEIMNIVSEPFPTNQIADIEHQFNGEQAEALKP